MTEVNMKRLHGWVIIVLILVFGAGNQAEAQDHGESVVTVKQVQDQLERVKNYQYGQSKAALTALDEMLRSLDGDLEKRAEVEKALLQLLESDATLPAKQYICETLSIYGTAASVPVLSSMLLDANTTEMALFALNRITDPTTVSALVKALPKISGTSKLGIIHALGYKKDPSAVSELIGVAENNEKDEAAAALNALGQIGTQSASAYLLKRFENTSDPLRSGTTYALMTCAESDLEEGKTEQAARLYETIFNGHENPEIQFTALRGLLVSRPDGAVEQLQKVLRAEDGMGTGVAIRLMKYIPGDQDISALIASWQSMNAEARAGFIIAMGARPETGIVEILKTALKSTDNSVRLAAISAVSSRSEPELADILTDISAQSTGRHSEAALEALVNMPGEALSAHLRKQAEREDNDIKIQLIKAMGRRFDKKALPLLNDYIDDADDRVRIESIRAIGSIGGDAEYKNLVRALTDPRHSKDREALKKSIVDLSKRQQKNRVTYLLDYIEEAKTEEARLAFIDVLAQTGDPDAVPLLRKSIQEGPVSSRIETIKSLEKWPDDSFRDDLLFIAEGASDEKMRILALRGFVRAIGLGDDTSPEVKSILYQRSMKLAKTDAERKMILSAAATEPTLEALLFVSNYIDNPVLQNEAAAAAITIVERMHPKYGLEGLEVLESINLETTAEALKDRIMQSIVWLRREAGYIYKWQVAGPYKKSDVNLFEHPFPPETAKVKNIEWRRMEENPQPGLYWMIPLDQKIGGDHSVAYLRNRVWSENNCEALLELGSDDGIKVWLNDKLVHAHDANRAVGKGDDKVKVQLKKGWNELMLKISNGTGEWGASARIRDTDGGYLRGLRIALPE